jgi:hypothetical protein
MPDWTPVTLDELWIFLGLYFLMGIIRKPSMKDYWSTSPLLTTPVFPTAMSRNRFEAILRSLHFADNSRGDAQNKLWKLGSFLPDLVKTFEDRVNLGEFLGSHCSWQAQSYGV